MWEKQTLLLHSRGMILNLNTQFWQAVSDGGNTICLGTQTDGPFYFWIDDDRPFRYSHTRTLYNHNKYYHIIITAPVTKISAYREKNVHGHIDFNDKLY